MYSSTTDVPDQMPESKPAAPATSGDAGEVSRASGSKFVTHMKQYPLAVTTKQELMKLPYMEGVRDVLAPVVQDISGTIDILFLCECSDNMANTFLNQLDRIFPNLKTIQLNDITDPMSFPIVSIIAYGNQVYIGCNRTVDTQFIDPTKKVVNEMGNYYHKSIYNEHGKNKFLSPFDPLLKPINEQIKSMVLYLTPNTKIVTSEEATSEISRSKNIVWNFIVGKQTVTETVNELSETAAETANGDPDAAVEIQS